LPVYPEAEKILMLIVIHSYVRSSIPRKGKKPEVMDIKHDISYEHKKTIKTSDEGTYEVVAIKDKFCSFSSQAQVGKPQKLLAGS
jgi:nucleoporin POM152